MTSPNSAALARNRSAGAASTRPAAAPVAMRRTIAVVTRDDALADTLRRATPSRSVMVVATPMALADLLLQEHTAVLVLDAAVPGEHCPRLVEHLAVQFPELMLIAVGSREDEAALGAALADGRLYRFMHRPYSLARARTFVEAALERFDGQQAAPQDRRIRRITAAGFVLAALLLVAALVPTLRPPPPPAAPQAQSAAAPSVVVPRVAPRRTPPAPLQAPAAAGVAGASGAPARPAAASPAPPDPAPALDVPATARAVPDAPATATAEPVDTPF